MPLHGGIAAGAAAIFAAGLALGVFVGQGFFGHGLIGQGSRGAAGTSAPVRSPAAPAMLRLAYPAEVVRVLDGDTFEARVRVWPGMDAVTRVRLRGIDAPEMKARCDDERVKAVAARDALTRMLNAGAVGLSNVSQDKYGGRVDADASAADTPNLAEAMVALGLARRYDGGRRASWCDARN